MKKIVILGSTGFIGRQTLEIVRAYPEEFKVVGLTAYQNSGLLAKQKAEFKVEYTSLAEKDLVKIATLKEADLVVVAVVGLAGIAPTLAAIKAKKNIALATKEVLVVAGKLVMDEVKKNNVTLLPLDSEHSAIFQCLRGGPPNEIKRILLTIGKGSFATMSQQRLKKVTLADIYQNPTWRMGPKITIDSATCVNKSFEVLEASWLFGLTGDQINIVVHPQYLCHSLVEFIDGSILAELGTADMRRYIQYALFYPQRYPAKITGFSDLFGQQLSFEPAPFKKFPGLALGFKALKSGGTMGAVLHGADRIAVDAFVKGKVGFLEIVEIINKTMDAHKVINNPTLDQLLEAEKWAGEYAFKLIN